jgi:hypothetical protein
MATTTQDTQIRLFETPRPTTLRQVMAQQVTTFLVAGIVNPFGPTLNAVVAAGMLDPGVTLPIMRLMLNPFSQEIETLGEISVAESWRPSAVIYPLFDLPFGSCPTLVLPSQLLDAERAALLHADFLQRFDDARRVLEDVKQFFGNPWDRVSMEMHRSTAEMKNPITEAKRPLDEKEATDLAGLLLSEKHVRPEFQAFLCAWRGSITHIAPGLATMSFNEFAHVLAHLTFSCHTPDLSGSQA